jgi:hypothetical protein
VKGEDGRTATWRLEGKGASSLEHSAWTSPAQLLDGSDKPQPVRGSLKAGRSDQAYKLPTHRRQQRRNAADRREVGLSLVTSPGSITTACGLLTMPTDRFARARSRTDGARAGLGLFAPRLPIR